MKSTSSSPTGKRNKFVKKRSSRLGGAIVTSVNAGTGMTSSFKQVLQGSSSGEECLHEMTPAASKPYKMAAPG